MQIHFKELKVAQTILICGQLCDIAKGNNEVYIDSVSISRILDILYKDLVDLLEKEPSLYTIAEPFQGFCYKVYALNIQQTTDLLKRLEKTVSQANSIAIMESLKAVKSKHRL